MSRILLITLLILGCLSTAQSTESVTKENTEAILILNGLGTTSKGRRQQNHFFRDKGYDVYIPKYIQRKSYSQSLEYFTNYYDQEKLEEYQAIHVFCYIMGGWVINEFILNEQPKNIKTIVYDRSPLQERAPRLVVDKIPVIGKIVTGNVVHEFNEVLYKPIDTVGISTAFIIESKASPLIRIFKKTVIGYGPIDWNNYDFQQNVRDSMYTHLNHKQMYTGFDVIGDPIMHFIQQGRFPEEAKRTPYDWDPYKKYKKRKDAS